MTYVGDERAWRAWFVNKRVGMTMLFEFRAGK